VERVQNNVACVGLLYDQLAAAVCSCSTLDVTFLVITNFHVSFMHGIEDLSDNLSRSMISDFNIYVCIRFCLPKLFLLCFRISGFRMFQNWYECYC
jgi:hypothetical protein